MANALAPSGFREGALYGASMPNYAVTTRYIAYNYSTQIGYGDPVILTSSGVINIYAKGGTTIDGIFLGCQYFNPSAPLNGAFQPAWTAPTLPSATIVMARVCIDPRMIFLVQGDGAALTQTSVGLNFDILSSSSGAPNAYTGLSTCAIDATTGATTATLPFRLHAIVGLNDGSGGVAISPSYSPTAANQWLMVSMNTQDLTQTTGI